MPTKAEAVLSHLEGNLTGCIYSDTQGSDEGLYARLAPALRRRVGRLLNDKMPTGVAVSPAMNHGGPVPGHRPSRVYRCRHSGIAAPLRDAVLLRQRPSPPTAGVAARREPERQDVAPD